MKSGLRKKYKLSTEEFCRCLRIAKISTKKSFVEFPYGLNVDVVEWLRGANAHGDVEWFVDLICLEHFYEALPDRVCTWVLIPSGVDTIRRAAALADEYVLSRGEGKANTAEMPQGEKQQEMPQPRHYVRRDSSGHTVLNKVPSETNQATGTAKQIKGICKPDKCSKEQGKPFDTRSNRCNEKGHFARSCQKGSPIFACVSGKKKNFELLKPHLKDMIVNGQECRVLRDSAATMDVVHRKYVSSSEYLSECVWIP